MEEKRKIRMPIGAAVACLLIVALLTVGIRLKRHSRFIRRQDRRPSF